MFPAIIVQVNDGSASALAVDAIANIKNLTTVRVFSVAVSFDLQRS